MLWPLNCGEPKKETAHGICCLDAKLSLVVVQYESAAVLLP